jgi:hypothetical protein
MVIGCGQNCKLLKRSPPPPILKSSKVPDFDSLAVKVESSSRFANPSNIRMARMRRGLLVIVQNIKTTSILQVLMAFRGFQSFSTVAVDSLDRADDVILL